MSNQGINRVTLLGNLGQEPELRYTQNRHPIVQLSIATSESWKDKAGNQKERTEWHRVVIHGKLAEIAGQYLHKGSQVYIEGQLQTLKWQDNHGQDRYMTEIVVQGYRGVMQLLGRADEVTKAKAHLKYGANANAGGGNANANAGDWPTNQEPNQSNGYNQQPQYNEPPINFQDDIPFAKIGLAYANGYMHCI